MLKTAINNCPENFRLEQKIPESRTVDGDVGSLDLFFGGAVGADGGLGGDLGGVLLFVVQKIVIGNIGHFVLSFRI